MISRTVTREAPVVSSPRTLQLCGMFDIEVATKSSRTWEVELPTDEREWSIGAFIGPSGSGKSTLMAEMFGAPKALRWHKDRAVIDDVGTALGIVDVTGVLSSVGFSSPPAWLRPFQTLSNGEQFRASVARTLLEAKGTAVIDEFTSVVDRTVAKIGSHAVAKFVRGAGRQLVVASCHYDIVDWLQPDWLYDTAAGSFTWRSLQRRPDVSLEVYRATTEAWRWFSHHHYLSTDLARSASCFVGLVEGQPAAFIAVLPAAGRAGMWRGTRIVVLPDFQGIALSTRLRNLIGSLYRAQGYRYVMTASHPALVHASARSADWRMTRRPSVLAKASARSTLPWYKPSSRRMTASFEFVGPAGSVADAEALDIRPRRR